MPVTPFHLGLGLLAKGIAPTRFSLALFSLSQLAIDLESGWFLLNDEYPFHRALHTTTGAAAACLATAVVGRAIVSRSARALEPHVPTLVGDVSRARRVLPLLLTIAASALGHVIPDGIMHADVRPFAPWADANPFLGVVPLTTLHLSLGLAAVAGSLLLLWRSRLRAPK